MSYGLEILSNVDSSVLVSDTVPAMLFMGKGSNSATYALGFGSSYYSYTNTGPVSSAMPMPVCFVACASGIVTHLREILVVGGYWTAKINLNSATAADVYWFSNPSNNSPSAETYGLRVYNASSVLIFDSGWGKFGSVREMPSITNSNGATVSFTNFSKPAFLQMNSYIYVGSYVYETRIQFRGLNYYTSGGIRLEDYIYYDDLTHAIGASYEGGTGGTFAVPIINGADYD
jgi:hypothetical protein